MLPERRLALTLTYYIERREPEPGELDEVTLLAEEEENRRLAVLKVKEEQEVRVVCILLL